MLLAGAAAGVALGSKCSLGGGEAEAASCLLLSMGHTAAISRARGHEKLMGFKASASVWDFLQVSKDHQRDYKHRDARHAYTASRQEATG